VYIPIHTLFLFLFRSSACRWSARRRIRGPIDSQSQRRAVDFTTMCAFSAAAAVVLVLELAVVVVIVVVVVVVVVVIVAVPRWLTPLAP